MSTLHFINQQRLFHSVQQLCQVLGVVPSLYYTLYDCTAFRWKVARKGNGVTYYA